MSSVKMRQYVERQIVRRVILDGKAKGYLFNIDNGDNNGEAYELPEPTNHVKTLLGAMFATDEERLYVFRPGVKKPFGWVFFVYGNDGWDVVSDYTVNLKDMMKGAHELAEKWC